MIYRAVILISLTAAILFVGGLTVYPSPLAPDPQIEVRVAR
jgi:hypothetical protein